MKNANVCKNMGTATRRRVELSTEDESGRTTPQEEITLKVFSNPEVEQRPNKMRKMMTVKRDAEDPVALARKALEMFKKEVEDDGDFVEPDTAPGDDNLKLSSPSGDKNRSMKTTKPNEKLRPQSHNTTEKQTGFESIWQKHGRAPLFSDDPSIL